MIYRFENGREQVRSRNLEVTIITSLVLAVFTMSTLTAIVWLSRPSDDDEGDMGLHAPKYMDAGRTYTGSFSDNIMHSLRESGQLHTVTVNPVYDSIAGNDSAVALRGGRVETAMAFPGTGSDMDVLHECNIPLDEIKTLCKMMDNHHKFCEAYFRDDERLMACARSLSRRGAQMMTHIDSTSIRAPRDYDELFQLVKKGRGDGEALQNAMDARATSGAASPPPMLLQNHTRIVNALKQSSLLLDANRQRFIYFSKRQQRMSQL